MLEEQKKLDTCVSYAQPQENIFFQVKQLDLYNISFNFWIVHCFFWL